MAVTSPIVVWGAGAMGSVIGAHLVRAGHAVRFVDIVSEHVSAIREDGLHITGPIADFTVKADAMLPTEVAGPLTTVFLCVKAHHTADAVSTLAPHLASDGVVVSVQNGLNEPVIADVIGTARTFGCFVNFGADYLEPGVVHYGGRGTVAVGEVTGGITERARAIHGLFRAFDERAILTDNVFGYLWSKLAYASMLFATALSDEGIADALDRAPHRAIHAALAREVVRVAHAEGVRLEPFDGFDPGAYDDASARAFAATGSTRTSPAEHASPDTSSIGPAASASLDALVAHNRRSAKTHSGIWRDLAVRKRRTEVDAQLGPIVAAGGRYGIATPLNARLIEMIHEIERGERVQCVANLDELGERLKSRDDPARPDDGGSP